MSMTYATFTTRFASLLVVEEDDADFLVMLPAAIDYAEGRIYRELNLITTSSSDTAGTVALGNRRLTPATRFVVVQQVNLSSSTVPKVALTLVTRDFLDAVYGSPSYPGQPRFYAMLSDVEIAVGPYPAATYSLEVIGTVRPSALSASNTTTWLTNYLPDLFLAAAMVFGAGWQKNFGAQSDDPKLAMSWEQQYQTLKSSADVEEIRKKAMVPPPDPPAGD